tara:strand:+ start:422 stop:691 length:270 start_codon:yes stop_codon:yes gene_type:complete
MDSYEVMHTLSQVNINYTGHTYFQAVVDGGATLGYKGTLFAPANTVVMNVSISSPLDIVGTTGDVVFLGKKKPELTRLLNTDGTWSIKG